MIGAAAMSLSSFFVVSNALRLNLFRLYDASKDKAPKKRTVLNIENRRGNPKLSILYPLVRYLNIDPYRIFYSTSKHISPARQQLHQLIDTCTDEEVELLLPIHRDVIFALRNNSKKKIK